jgi:hypothetical protein
MSARSQTTQEYDSITIRTIRATASAYTTLTSDGVGGTYWSTLSSPMAYVSAFKGICTPAKLYVADASYNMISFNSGQGIQFVPRGQFSTTLYAHAFNEIAVPGLSTLSSGQDKIAFSTLTLSSLGNTVFTTNPKTNTLTYEIRHPTFRIQNTLLPLNDQTSTITFIGQGDILFSTLNSKYFVGIQISTFTSTGYSALFSNISTVSTATISTISSLYTYATTFQSIFTNNYIPDLRSSISTVRGLTESTQFLYRELSNSTLFSRYYLDIVSELSSFSTSLYYEMEQKPSYFINETFGSKILYQNNQFSTVQNYIYDLNDISTFISSVVRPHLSVIQSEAPTNFDRISTLIGGEISTTTSTLKNLSSYAFSLAGNQMSSFNSTMVHTFKLLSSTGIRQDYIINPPYLVNSGVQVSKGQHRDITISTCQINLYGYDNYIDKYSRVFIDYTPSYAFKSIRLTAFSTLSTNLPNLPANTYIPANIVYSMSSINTQNVYPVCTFVKYQDYILPNLRSFSDMISFNVSNAISNIYPYNDIHSRRMRLEVDPLTVKNTDPENPYYTIHHFHSSIINLYEPVLFINDPDTNMFGGAVVPTSYMRECDLSLRTNVTWSNSTDVTSAVSLYIHNGLYQK